MEALRIRIPERYQPGIAKLISLSENSVEELLLVLNTMPPSMNLESIKGYITSKISTLSENDVDEIISALDSLYYIHYHSDTTLQDFSEHVLQAMIGSGNEELQLDVNLREPFKGRLIRFMSVKFLNISIRSREIFYEQERIFGSARILTDIRSVFGEDPENNPEAAVVIQTLKIHYIQNDQHQEFFVALDAGDISLLIDILIRAQEKAETLKSILAGANVPYIDAE